MCVHMYIRNVQLQSPILSEQIKGANQKFFKNEECSSKTSQNITLKKKIKNKSNPENMAVSKTQCQFR